MNIFEFSRNSNFFGPKRTFPVLGLQKTSQELTFIKVSEPGPQKSDSGPKSHFWAPEMLKNNENSHILVKWRCVYLIGGVFI